VFSRKIEPAPDFFDALAVELAYCHEKPTKVSSTNKVVLMPRIKRMRRIFTD